MIGGDLNARLYDRMPVKNKFIGPHLFKNPTQLRNPSLNRHLLIELCSRCHLQVANTFFDKPVHNTVTYVDIGFNSSSPITDRSHAELDVFLVSLWQFNSCKNVHSNRNIALSSRHSIVIADFEIDLARKVQGTTQARLDLSSLCQEPTQSLFLQSVEKKLDECVLVGGQNCTSTQVTNFTDAIKSSAHEVLPKVELTARRPWISARTLKYIRERNMARQLCNQDLEKTCHKLVKSSVKQDRTTWLHTLLATGSW